MTREGNCVLQTHINYHNNDSIFFSALTKQAQCLSRKALTRGSGATNLGTTTRTTGRMSRRAYYVRFVCRRDADNKNKNPRIKKSGGDDQTAIAAAARACRTADSKRRDSARCSCACGKKYAGFNTHTQCERAQCFLAEGWPELLEPPYCSINGYLSLSSHLFAQVDEHFVVRRRSHLVQHLAGEGGRGGRNEHDRITRGNANKKKTVPVAQR